MAEVADDAKSQRLRRLKVLAEEDPDAVQLGHLVVAAGAEALQPRISSELIHYMNPLSKTVQSFLRKVVCKRAKRESVSLGSRWWRRVQSRIRR